MNKDIIIMKVYLGDNPPIVQEWKTTTFSRQSGVRTLLELDSESRVEIHKPNNSKITYEYAPIKQ